MGVEMADHKMDALKHVPLFARCSKAELRTLAMNTDEVDVEAGRTLIVQGQSNHTFFILVSGEVEVDIQGQPSHRLGPGDFFGEISMLDSGPATATVVTKTPADVLVMSHAQFQNAIKANEAIALQVIAVMAERLRENARAAVY
jgi:CRP-like cAMP-binding protein